MKDPRRDTGAGHYGSADPRSWVSPSVLEFLLERAGRQILDLGSGPGGYARELADRGREVLAADRNPRYVEQARALGITAELLAGDRLPFADRSFDTVVLIEVLEHVPEAEADRFLAEVNRVTRQNVLLTVPDSSQTGRLAELGLTYEHHLTLDHVRFFDRAGLEAALAPHFKAVVVREGDPVMPHRLLPAVIRRPLSLLYRLGVLRPTLHMRLFAEARV